MTHTVVLAFLALSLSSNPHVNAGSKATRRSPPPTEQPKPPPVTETPPPRGEEPEEPTPQTGPTQEELVRATIQRNMRPIESCYEIARTRLSKPQGEVVVEFDINSSGYVEREKVTSNTTGSTELERCILQEVRGWHFQDKNAPGFTPRHVRHPFRFQTSS